MAAAAILAGLVAIVYGRAVGAGFVFDDHALVVENPLVRESPARIGGLFLHSPERAGFAYRPVRVLSYQVDHLLAGGMDPRVFHLSNLVYHVLATWLLWSLARAMLDSDPAAMVAASLFAVHPLGTEAVAYVSGRRDLLCALFALLALRCWWAFLAGADRTGDLATGAASDRRPTRATPTLAVALVAALLSLGSKETALVLPVLAWFMTFVRSPGARAGMAPRVIGSALLAATAALGAGLVSYRERFTPLLERAASPPLAPQPALTLRTLGRYLRLAAFPDELSADYRAGAFELPRSALDAHSLAAGFALGGLAALGAVLLRAGRVAGLGLLWFLVALVPVAQFVPYGEVVAEHNAYLPVAGLALAVGDAFTRFVPGRRRLAGACAVAVVALLAARSWYRVADWRDETTLWRSTLEVAPASQRALHNLGAALAADGQLLAARDPLERAHAADPDDLDVRLTLARLLADLGDGERATALAKPVVERRRDAGSWNVLGWAQLSAGDPVSARSSFEEARALGSEGEAEEGLRAIAGGGGRR